MAKLIQYMTKESLYDGAFDNSYWAAAGMGYVIVTENKKFIVIDGGHPNDSDSLIELLILTKGGGTITMQAKVSLQRTGSKVLS